MKNVLHTINANLQSGTCKYTPIDIHQYDQSSHVLCIQLCNDRSPIFINEGTEFKLEFNLNDTTIEAEGIETINPYKGTVSYVISPNVIENHGRYTAVLKIKNDDAVKSVSFVVNVAKSHNHEFKSREVVVTKEFYDNLVAHLKDKSLHLSEEERDFLETFVPRSDELTSLLNSGLQLETEVNETENPVQSKAIKKYVDDAISLISSEVGNILKLVGDPE